jgi:hypothetical protein
MRFEQKENGEKRIMECGVDSVDGDALIVRDADLRRCSARVLLMDE